MERCKPITTPTVVKEKISNNNDDSGANALVCCVFGYQTRYLMFAVSLLSRFIHSPSQIHLGTAKKVLRYITGSTNIIVCSF